MTSGLLHSVGHLKVDRFGLCILLVQIVLALYYYTPLHCDKYDERFAWRMLSEIGTSEKSFQIECFNVVGRYNATMPCEYTNYFNKRWQFVIEMGDSYVMKRAVEFICIVEGYSHVKYNHKFYFTDGSIVERNNTIVC